MVGVIARIRRDRYIPVEKAGRLGDARIEREYLKGVEQVAVERAVRRGEARLLQPPEPAVDRQPALRLHHPVGKTNAVPEPVPASPRAERRGPDAAAINLGAVPPSQLS